MLASRYALLLLAGQCGVARPVAFTISSLNCGTGRRTGSMFFVACGYERCAHIEMYEKAARIRRGNRRRSCVTDFRGTCNISHNRLLTRAAQKPCANDEALG